MVTHANSHPELWPHERHLGYEDRRVTAYVGGDTTHIRRVVSWIRWEERLGSLIAAAGLVWGVRALAAGAFARDVLWQTPGPLETCAIGILLWLHAKWQRSVKLR